MTVTTPDKFEQNIQQSKLRSASYLSDTKRIRPKLKYDDEALYSLLEKEKSFLQTTIPFLQELNEVINNEEFVLLLTDAQGCILEVLGSAKAQKDVGEKGILKGVVLNEENAGTNAVALSILQKEAIQIKGNEHYLEIYAHWTTSAAPIWVNEKIEGFICTIGDLEQGHVHTLALVKAIAKSLSMHIENREIQKQLFDSNQYAFAMMNSLDYGVFAINIFDNIQWVNDTACRKLNIRRMNLLEKPIQKIYPDWAKAKKKLLEMSSFDDEQGQFNLKDLKARFLFNAIPIITKEKEILGFILMFRELNRMIKALNKHAGLDARFTFESIITQNDRVKKIHENARIIARSPSTVLITGESGTGKEVFAQAIHNASPRAEGPFVALNCGAISATLIESELFGYEEGAFTDAKKGGRSGKFELADCGTLFLDEIGEMSLEMQIRLLRALQEGAITRVGSDKPINIDVRVIAATNKNLMKEVKEGRFRLDLYYRLDVVQLVIPPLRERQEDILPLFRYFLNQKAEKLKMNIPSLDGFLLDKIELYNWPGNVRELENFAEKMVLFQGNYSPEILDFDFGQLVYNSVIPQPLNNEIPKHDIQQSLAYMPKTLADMEKETILNTLRHTSNNITKAASILNISRNTLYMKLKSYNIEI